MLPSSSAATSRARKVERACDSCRRRKTKCDGPKLGVCSNCRAAHKSCTYLEASTPRGPPKAYVTALEDRLEELENLLQKVRPDADFSAELGPAIPRGSWREDGGTSPVASASRRPPRESSPSHVRVSTHLALNTQWRRNPDDSDSESDGDNSSSDSEYVFERLKGGLRKLTLYTGDKDRRDYNKAYDSVNHRFHGKSSMITLLNATRRYKDLYVTENTVGETERESASQPADVHGHTCFPSKRPEFWTAHPWELQWEGFEIDHKKLLASVLEEFPPPALATELIELYFKHSNAQLPLLHRPTFERQFRDNVHHDHLWFSCVCLGVFAVASRWCNDPLVLPRKCKRTTDGGLDWTCAGWHYNSIAMGIHRIRQSLLHPACLEEIQSFTLLAAFLRGTASANHAAAWVFISNGIRKAQDVGAHRKKVYGDTPSVEDELWKRAFWCLVAYDRWGSAILGRPCASGEEDFDLDPCLEVNDEYWEADPPFKQPRDEPCRFTYFNLWVRLSQIVIFTMKSIYAFHNPKALLGRIAKVRTDEVMAQLTLALQDWLHSIPDYLRWSPHIEDEGFANQSASLQVTYYLTEMLMYRAFIPALQAPASNPAPHIRAPFPALTYCINVARSCARIIEVQLPRGWNNTPLLITVSQLSATILTLGVWDAKVKEPEFEDIKPPPAHTIASLMDDIAILIGALETAEARWENVPHLIRGLKEALPKEDSNIHSKPPIASHIPEPIPLDSTVLHSFDDTPDDHDHWTLPSHSSSSMRTRPTGPHDEQPSYSTSSPYDFPSGSRPVKYDADSRSTWDLNDVDVIAAYSDYHSQQRNHPYTGL